MKNIFVNSEFRRKLAACFGALSPGCRQAARLQSRALVQPLSWSERLGLRLHLLICAWCRRFGEHVKYLRSVAHQCPENQPVNASSGLTVEGRERIKRAMQAKRSDHSHQANLAGSAGEINTTETRTTHRDGNLMMK